MNDTSSTTVESMNPYDACSQIAGELTAAIALLQAYKMANSKTATAGACASCATFSNIVRS